MEELRIIVVALEKARAKLKEEIRLAIREAFDSPCSSQATEPQGGSLVYCLQLHYEGRWPGHFQCYDRILGPCSCSRVGSPE